MKQIAFDFDMTLADTKHSILESLKHTFEMLGLEPKYDIDSSFEALKALKIKEQIRYLLPNSKVIMDITTIVDCYLRNYLEFGIPKTNLFDGVLEMFELLKIKGFNLHIVSAKSEVNLMKSIEFTGLIPDYVVANVAGDEKASYLVKTKCNTYVGDARADIEVATIARCQSIIVNPNFSEVASWQQKPNWHFFNVMELLKWIKLESNLSLI